MNTVYEQKARFVAELDELNAKWHFYYDVAAMQYTCDDANCVPDWENVSIFMMNGNVIEVNVRGDSYVSIKRDIEKALERDLEKALERYYNNMEDF